jgi:hypothetical protein
MQNNVPQAISVMLSLRDIACQRFMFDYVIPPTLENPYSSFMAFVPKLCLSADTNSPASAALSAAAFANFAGRFGSDEARTRSVEEYGRAIQLLKTTIGSEENHSCMELLATSSLLGTYELQTAPYLTKGGSWTAHVNGSVAILNMNFSADQLTADVGGLFQGIVSQMLIMRMSGGLRPTIPIDLCKKFFPPNSLATNMLYEMMYETAHFIADWNEGQKSYDKDDLTQFSRRLIKEGQDLDARLVKWMKARPSSWDVQKLDNCEKVVPTWLKGLFASKGAPSTLHMHTAFYIAHRWAFWRSTRITLHGALLDMIDIQIANASSLEEENEFLTIQRVLQVRMYDLVDAMCEGMFATFVVPIPEKPEPTSIEEVAGIRAMSLMWPLSRAGMTLKRESMQSLDVHQRFQWVRSSLEFLHKEMGTAKAKAFLDNLDGYYDETYNWP